MKYWNRKMTFQKEFKHENNNGNSPLLYISMTDIEIYIKKCE